MSSAISTSDPVESYLGGLNRALVGPRRRKADLLAEARDGLVDATEAFESDGLSVDEAKLRAVEDFGDLAEVVPGYRAELGIAQGRRTAVLLFLVLIAQPIVWLQGVWAWTQQPEAANTFVAFLNQAVEVVGTLSIAGAVLAVVATGIGLRYPLVRDRATRATAIFALVSCAAVGVIALGMGLFSNELHGNVLAGLSVVGGFVLLPLAFVMHSAHRCLRLA
ncbi:hypothetical protein EV643_101661 [Kribbella sp. VKM Ac-2527]|uniref:Uncharacterized protein n=1 Tax=Kribbella caucasensis TaxID=2512215 RepID=A0A4V3CB86_9ACTN|nr:permease prefix domain 1-containing protein [Kribbella sp. VKM Ac-2527]TDO54870.1 hypothetical protein EV643_101661 [Kribbella sp. VKM Ac-2527]